MLACLLYKIAYNYNRPTVLKQSVVALVALFQGKMTDSREWGHRWQVDLKESTFWDSNYGTDVDFIKDLILFDKNSLLMRGSKIRKRNKKSFLLLSFICIRIFEFQPKFFYCNYKQFYKVSKQAQFLHQSIKNSLIQKKLKNLKPTKIEKFCVNFGTNEM